MYIILRVRYHILELQRDTTPDRVFPGFIQIIAFYSDWAMLGFNVGVHLTDGFSVTLEVCTEAVDD